MRLPVWIESDGHGASIAFAFDFPGACGWGDSLSSALQKLVADVDFTSLWLRRHGINNEILAVWSVPPIIVETVIATGKPSECDTEGFYQWDTTPYSDGDLETYLRLLRCIRADTEKVLGSLPETEFDTPIGEGKRTVREIVDHIAIAEWWYTTRVPHPFEHVVHWTTFGHDAITRFTNIREMYLTEFIPSLSTLSAKQRSQVHVLDGEFWSFRKVLRRTVWHELFHFKQLVRTFPVSDWL